MLRKRAPALLVLLAGLPACGRKMPPAAPLQVIPARVAPLHVSQEGSDVVLRFPYPSRTAQGEPLTDLTAVTVWRELLSGAPGARPPAPPDGPFRAREEKAFLLRAAKLAELSSGELRDATSGDEIVFRDSLLPLVTERKFGRVILRYGVTVTRDRRRVSELSPLVAIYPRIPPDRPLGLSATIEEKRVCLDWLRPQQMLDGGRAVTVAGYAVYRRGLGEEAYDRPLGVVLRSAFIDEAVASGNKYLYTVRAAPTSEEPLVLGPAADEVLVDTADVFPPPAPEGLIVLSEEGGNRLVWNPVLAPDLDGYRVYRRPPGGAFAPVAGPLKEPTWVDRGGPREAVYAVTAVDLSGNESPRAESAAR